MFCLGGGLVLPYVVSMEAAKFWFCPDCLARVGEGGSRISPDRFVWEI